MKNETIRVDGKFYSRSKVVMLPTEKASKLIFDNDLQELKYHPSGIRIDLLNVESYQHLYFLSSEAIVEGDWYEFNGFIEQAGKCGQLNIKAVNGFMRDINDCKKIIATTDGSLDITYISGKDEDAIKYRGSLPRPSNEFLQAYCKASGKIDEVSIEVELHYEEDTSKDYIEGKGQPAIELVKLKVAPDNTITIKKVGEQKYSAEEIDKRVNMYDELVDGLKRALKMFGRGYEPKKDAEDTIGSKLYAELTQLLKQSSLK